MKWKDEYQKVKGKVYDSKGEQDRQFDINKAFENLKLIDKANEHVRKQFKESILFKAYWNEDNLQRKFENKVIKFDDGT